MNKTVKKVLSNVLISTVIAYVIFVLNILLQEFLNDGMIMTDNYMFLKSILACIGIGLGFGLPVILYEKENLSTLMKLTIHFVVGCTTLVLIILSAGWLPEGTGWSNSLGALVTSIAIATIIWLGFYYYNKQLANKMNERLKEKHNS